MDTSTLDAQQKQVEELGQAISQMEPFVTVSDNGALALTADSAEQVGIDPTIFDQLVTSMHKTNDLLSSAQLSLSDIGLATAGGQAPVIELTSGAANCAGRNSVQRFWWGILMCVDECKTQQLVTLASAGAPVAAIAAQLAAIGGEEAVVVAVAAGVVALGGALVKLVDAQGGNQGVCFTGMWVGGLLVDHQ